MIVRRIAGFTLIELVVVLFILGLASALIFPRLPESNASSLRRSATGLAAALRTLDEEAIAGKTTYRMIFDLALEKITVSVLRGGEALPTDDPRLRRTLLADGVTLKDLRLPRLGTVTAGQVEMDIGPAGIGEFLTVHIANERGENYTVMAFPGSGKVRVIEGYEENPL